MSSAIVPVTSKLYSTQDNVFNLLKNSNCWIDFSDNTKYTTTGGLGLRLASVTDKSNDARTITVTGTVQFDEGSKSMFNLTGTSNYLDVNTGAVSTTLNSETVFLVVSQANNVANTPSFFGSISTGTRYARFGSGFTYGRQGASLIGGLSALPAGEVMVLSVICDNTNIRTFYNGKFDGTGTIAFTATQSTRIGQAGTAYIMIGNLYEIIFFNDAIGDDQRQLIEYYLMKKWTITSTISSPTSITGCTLWLDGNDASTITFSSGTSISRWADKSGNNYHAVQATAARQPTYDSATKGVNFLQSSVQFMTSTAPYTGSANEECIYIVFKQTNAANANLIGTTDTARGRQIRTQGSRLVVYNGATLAITGVRTLNTTNIFIVEFMNVTGRCLTNINKAVDGTSAKVSFAAGTWTQVIGGATTSGAVSYNGQIYEMVIFNRALASSERLSMMNYLFTKWNINPGPTLIPYQQPYARIPPYLRYSIPTDVLGCVLWLDAADATTVTLSGSSVTQWNDKSGIANHASGGVSPTYDRTTNAVVFNGTTHYLTTAHSASLTTETLFMVGTLTGSTASGNYHTLVASSLNGGRHLFTNASALNLNRQNVTPGPLGGTFSANQRTLFQYRRDLSNTVTLLLNGSSVATTTLAAYTTGLTTWIGRWPGTTTDNWEGSIHELIIYSKAISKSERQLVEGYLAQKWGLKTGLPSTHSFRTELALSPIFNPGKFGLHLWLDAADPLGTGIPPSSGTAITTWVDKSPMNKSCSQPTVSRKPTFTYDGSYPAIYFDRANTQFLDQDSPVGLLPTRFYGIFIVSRATTEPNDSEIYCTFHNQKTSTLTTTNNTIFVAILQKNSTGTLFRNNTNVHYANGGTASITGKFYSVSNPSNPNDRNLMEILDDSGIANNCFFENGSSGANFSYVGSFANVTTDLFGYTVGTSSSNGTPSTTNCLNGYIYEIIVTTYQPTFFQRQQIEGYLAWKWGIQSKLPNTHPYSKYPPN